MTDAYPARLRAPRRGVEGGWRILLTHAGKSEQGEAVWPLLQP